MNGVRLIILLCNIKNIIIILNNIIKILLFNKNYDKIKNDKADQYNQSVIHSDESHLIHWTTSTIRHAELFKKNYIIHVKYKILKNSSIG